MPSALPFASSLCSAAFTSDASHISSLNLNSRPCLESVLVTLSPDPVVKLLLLRLEPFAVTFPTRTTSLKQNTTHRVHDRR